MAKAFSFIYEPFVSLLLSVFVLLTNKKFCKYLSPSVGEQQPLEASELLVPTIGLKQSSRPLWTPYNDCTHMRPTCNSSGSSSNHWAHGQRTQWQSTMAVTTTCRMNGVSLFLGKLGSTADSTTPRSKGRRSKQATGDSHCQQQFPKTALSVQPCFCLLVFCQP